MLCTRFAALFLVTVNRALFTTRFAQDLGRLFYERREGFEHVGFEESVWVRPKGGKYGEDIYVSTHVDDCLICCKSTTTMSKFNQELLTRFQGTD